MLLILDDRTHFKEQTMDLLFHTSNSFIRLTKQNENRNA